MDRKQKNEFCCQEKEFYHLVEVQKKTMAPCEYVLAALDFDNFNYINDLFSYETGNLVLRRLERHFALQMKEGEIVSRVNADHFVFWVKADKKESLIDRFLMLADVNDLFSDMMPSYYHFVCSGGIAYAEDPEERISSLIDKASFARKRAKGKHINTILVYDDSIAQEIFWKKRITLTMEKALETHEFVMYLQPKIRIRTNQVVGAEALVRWNSKKYGMIYPDRFIPVFEQNGFIEKLDFFMLETACEFLRDMKETGQRVLPISVNFSKMHIQDDNFVEHVFRTVYAYGISTNLIEIEFTENVLADDFQRAVDVVSFLKYMGFKVSLDDFGSAYSSLNALKDMPFDVIKIDKGFLNASTNTDKGRVIVAKMVELIKSLHLVSVMEGIEQEEEAEFMEKLSCDIGQGYFYARPMPVSGYLDYLSHMQCECGAETLPDTDSGEGVELSYLQAIPQEFQMDNWELYTLGKNIDMGLMKGYLDGEATVQYVNDKALEYLGYSRQEFREIFQNRITAFTHPEDAAIVQANAEEMIRHSKPLKFQTRAIRKDGKIIILRGRASCVVDSHGRSMGIYAFQDVTEELEKEEQLHHVLEEKVMELESRVKSEQESLEALRISEERYRLAVEQSDEVMLEWDFETDHMSFSEKFKQMLSRDPIRDHISTNPLLRQNIYPEDLEIFDGWIHNTYRKAGESITQFRLRTGNESYIRINVRSTGICDSCGSPVRAVGVLQRVG